MILSSVSVKTKPLSRFFLIYQLLLILLTTGFSLRNYFTVVFAFHHWLFLSPIYRIGTSKVFLAMLCLNLCYIVECLRDQSWALSCPLSIPIRHILARHKRRKCLATGSKELSWLTVRAPKWHFMTSLAKNMLGFSPFWASKSKTRFQQATKMKQIIGFLFWPIREEHQQHQRSPGSSVARWVILKLEKPSKIPIYKFVSSEI